MIEKIEKSPFARWLPLLPVLLAVLLYLPGLENALTLGDISFLKDNKLASEDNSIGAIFGNTAETPAYRPLSLTFLNMQYDVWGENSTYFHMVSLCLHALSAFLFFFFLKKTGTGIFFSTVVALLFAAHPVNSQPVLEMGSQQVLWMGAFLLSAVILFIDYLKDLRWQALLISQLLFFMALLSHEGALAMVLIFPLLTFLFPGKRKLPVSLLYIFPLVFLLAIREAVLPAYTLPKVYENALMYTGSLSHRWAMGFEFFTRYMQKSLLPLELSYDYGYQVFPVHGWGGWRSIAGVVLFLLLAVLALVSAKKHPLRSVGAAFVLAGLIPFIQQFVTLPGNFSETNLYLPVMGIIILLGDLAKKISFIPWVFLLLVLPAAFFSFRRTGDWKDTAKLAGTDIKKMPGSFRIHYDLAQVKYEKALLIADEGTRRKALETTMESLTETIGIYGKHPGTWYYLGMCNLGLGEYTTAEMAFSETVRWQPDHSLAYNNLGNIQYLKGEKAKAKTNYELALRYDPQNPEANTNLGAIYLLTGQNDSAYFYLQKALEISPSDPNTQYNLDIARKRLGY